MQWECCLHSYGGHKIIYFQIYFGRYICFTIIQIDHENLSSKSLNLVTPKDNYLIGVMGYFKKLFYSKID